jgi:hypothetical protein
MGLEEDLARATLGWTIGEISRSYDATRAGEMALAREGEMLSRHAYIAVRRSSFNDGDRHVNAGRTLAKAAMTGGIGLALFGRSRSRGKIYTLVTFERRESEPFEYAAPQTGQRVAQGMAPTLDGVGVDELAGQFTDRLPVNSVTVEVVGPPPWHARVRGVLYNAAREDVEAADLAVIARGGEWRDAERANVVIERVAPGGSQPFQVDFPPPIPRMLNGEAWTASAFVTRVRTRGRWLNSPDQKACIDCGELIHRDARVCRFCGYRDAVQLAELHGVDGAEDET